MWVKDITGVNVNIDSMIKIWSEKGSLFIDGAGWAYTVKCSDVNGKTYILKNFYPNKSGVARDIARAFTDYLFNGKYDAELEKAFEQYGKDETQEILQRRNARKNQVLFDIVQRAAEISRR